MVDISDFKQKIIDNADEYIPQILEELGCSKIKKLKDEYRCTTPTGDNPTSICVKLDNLYSVCYTSDISIKGDLFVLIQKLQNCSFYESVSFIENVLGIKTIESKPKIEIFDGYFKKFKKYFSNETTLEVYPESELDNFLLMPHRRFIRDGISIDTQFKYNVGYDLNQDRIIVPWRHMTTGELIGIMGRYNDDDIPDNLAKWYPLIAFPKSQALFGYYQNYNTMVNNTVIVLEAEKSGMQLDSMDIFSGVAIGGHAIQPSHKKLINALYPRHIIVALDSDISEEAIIEETKKLIPQNQFSETTVSYIYDRKGEIIKPHMKVSPTDMRKEVLKELMQKHRHYVKK